MNRRLAHILRIVAALCLLPASGAVAGGVQNGAFTIADPLQAGFGWSIPAGSDVRVSEGRAILAEGGTVLPRLAQSFVIPAGTTELRFEIAALDLVANAPTEPVDAFEVHLLDAEGQSLFAPLSLDGTTAFFNYQQSGEVYYAPGIAVSGAPASGAFWNPAAFPVTVRFLYDPPTQSDTAATLMFAIVGAGAAASTAAVDNVVMVARPVAVDDGAATLEDLALDIAVLQNDRDPDGSLDPASVLVTGGPAHGEAVLNSQTGVVTYRPALNFNGSDAFSYTVTDDAGNLSDPALVTVTVAAVNDPPATSAGSDQTADEGSVVTLDGAGSSDPEGDALFYSWEQTAGPAVILSDPGAAAPTFTAPDVGPGGAALTFRLTVRDREPGDAQGLSADDECTVQVDWVNQAPVADAGQAQTVAEGAAVTLDGSASYDPDPASDGIQTFAWRQTGGPEVALSDPSSASPGFTAPDVGPGGAVLAFELTVTDRGADYGAQSLSDSAAVAVTVEWIDQPPTARAGEDRSVDEGTVVNLDGSGSSDPDDGIAAYLWTVVDSEGLKTGQEVVLSDPGAASPYFTAPRVERAGGALTLRLTVTDAEAGQALAHSDEIRIAIANVVLADAITVLRLLNGLPPGPIEITLEADRDGDGRFGLPDAVFILRRLAVP
jgi:hypothetical protein